ncbi:pyrroloquinoline quinone precursor peptide PqqA [Paenibacillus sp. MMO-58]
MLTYNESCCLACRYPPKGGMNMWVKPEFKIIEICAEVTAYAYRK